MACWRFMACWCGVSGTKAYDWLIAFWSESSSPRESSCNQSAVARLLGTPPRALATDFEGAASCPPRLAGAYRETPPWFVINAVWCCPRASESGPRQGPSVVKRGGGAPSNRSPQVAVPKCSEGAAPCCADVWRPILPTTVGTPLKWLGTAGIRGTRLQLIARLTAYNRSASLVPR